MKIEIVRLTAADWRKCDNFANASVDSSIAHYRRRKQGNRDKIIQDIRTGKAGELATYRCLRRKGLECSAPDFNVYESGKKSWDADIAWQDYQFHCKSQTRESVNKYGISWILQYGGLGHGHQDKLFIQQTPNDFLVPTVVDNDFVTIYGIIPVATLFEQNMIKEPKIAWFADTKRAIYLDDIKTLSYFYRWGKFNQIGVK